MKPVRQLLGERIKDIRKSKGFSQVELSEKLEISPNFLSRIEVGAKYPSLDTLEKMSIILEVELKDLFDFGYLQEGSTDVNNIEKLLEKTDEGTRLLVYKIIKSII